MVPSPISSVTIAALVAPRTRIPVTPLRREFACMRLAREWARAALAYEQPTKLPPILSRSRRIQAEPDRPTVARRERQSACHERSAWPKRRRDAVDADRSGGVRRRRAGFERRCRTRSRDESQARQKRPLATHTHTTLTLCLTDRQSTNPSELLFSIGSFITPALPSHSGTEVISMVLAGARLPALSLFLVVSTAALPAAPSRPSRSISQPFRAVYATAPRISTSESAFAAATL